MLVIRVATETDFEAIWPIFHEIVSAGETYTIPADTSKVEGRRLWMELPPVDMNPWHVLAGTFC